MAAKEIADYFTGTIVADYVATILSLEPQGEIVEEGNFNQSVHMGDDGSEERISISSTPIFYVNFEYKYLSESDIGTLWDFYFNTSKANGIANSFKWSSRGDGHTYVVRFDSKLSRSGIKQSLMGAKAIRFRILGVSA